MQSGSTDNNDKKHQFLEYSIRKFVEIHSAYILIDNKFTCCIYSHLKNTKKVPDVTKSDTMLLKISKFCGLKKIVFYALLNFH